AAGSFQSNIDGSLAVRFIQGFVSQNGVICAQLAQRGITGPDHYITGLYGYYHLFCKDRRDQATLVDDLGNRWNLYQMGFKSAPSCGCTIAPTDLILDLVNRHPVDPDAVARIATRTLRSGPGDGPGGAGPDQAHQGPLRRHPH